MRESLLEHYKKAELDQVVKAADLALSMGNVDNARVLVELAEEKFFSFNPSDDFKNWPNDNILDLKEKRK